MPPCYKTCCAVLYDGERHVVLSLVLLHPAQVSAGDWVRRVQLQHISFGLVATTSASFHPGEHEGHALSPNNPSSDTQPVNKGSSPWPTNLQWGLPCRNSLPMPLRATRNTTGSPLKLSCLQPRDRRWGIPPYGQPLCRTSIMMPSRSRLIPRAKYPAPPATSDLKMRIPTSK